jgi:hypothetical protein
MLVPSGSLHPSTNGWYWNRRLPSNFEQIEQLTGDLFSFIGHGEQTSGDFPLKYLSGWVHFEQNEAELFSAAVDSFLIRAERPAVAIGRLLTHCRQLQMAADGKSTLFVAVKFRRASRLRFLQGGRCKRTIGTFCE